MQCNYFCNVLPPGTTVELLYSLKAFLHDQCLVTSISIIHGFPLRCLVSKELLLNSSFLCSLAQVVWGDSKILDLIFLSRRLAGNGCRVMPLMEYPTIRMFWFLLLFMFLKLNFLIVHFLISLEKKMSIANFLADSVQVFEHLNVSKDVNTLSTVF